MDSTVALKREENRTVRDVELSTASVSACNSNTAGKHIGDTPPSSAAMPPARVDQSSGTTDGQQVSAAERKDQAQAPNSSKLSSGRRVRFPEGSLVTREIDPPNPWRNARETCTDELCAAYQAGCAQMNLRPSQNILHQLQMVKDFTTRADNFNLQGEKLDAKSVETLEEIFKRVQFDNIDVEGTGLDDEATMALCDMIEFYQSTCKLVFASNRSIGVRGWQAASRLLRRTPCLHTFDARNTSWTEHSMPAMSRAMRVDSSITTLHLEACNLSGRPHFLLMSALRTNSTLRELFLADNRLMPSDAIHIGGMLRHNSGLKLLDLRNNNVQDTGMSNISNGLGAQSKGGLTTLVLWNNHITHNGAAHLGKALIKSTNLETLNLGQNNLGTDGIHMLKEGLMKNKSLMRLGMYSCRISDEGAVALAEYLADNTCLMRLDLRENDIRTGGMMALSLSLKVNTVLLRLDLDKDVKKESLRGHEELQQSLLADICNLLARNRQILEQEQREEEEEENAEDENSNIAEQQGEDSRQTIDDQANYNSKGQHENLPPNVQEITVPGGGEIPVLSKEGVVTRNTRDPLMGVESAQEALVLLGSASTSSTIAKKKIGNDVKVTQERVENVSSNKTATLDHKNYSIGSCSEQVVSSSSLPVSTSSSATSSSLTSSSSSTSATATPPSELNVVTKQSSQEENSSSPPGIRINENIKLLTQRRRSSSSARIVIPADESKLLHSDSIDVEPPQSPSPMQPLDSNSPKKGDGKDSDASTGTPTLVNKNLDLAGDTGDVPSPDTELFGHGVPLNIDGKIGNGLLAGVTDSLFLPHIQARGQGDVADIMPSPEFEQDVEHMFAMAQGL